MRKSYKRRNMLFLGLVCLIGVTLLLNKLDKISAYEPEMVIVESKETKLVSSDKEEKEEFSVIAKTTEEKLTPAKSNGITDGVKKEIVKSQPISGLNKKVEPETLTKSADKAEKKVKAVEVTPAPATVETTEVVENPVVETPTEVVEVVKADFNDLQMDIPDAPPTPASVQEELVIIDYSDRLITDTSELNGDVLVIE